MRWTWSALSRSSSSAAEPCAGSPRHPGAIVVLAEAAGELVGFCVVNMEVQTGYVVTLDVAPARRRRGLARRLMAEAETRLRAAGGIVMALHVSTANTAAMQFYESIGYGRVGMAEGFLWARHGCTGVPEKV